MGDAITDDNKIDRKLDILEEELEIMETQGRDLIRRLSDVSTPRNRSRMLEEVDHASLINRLVSNIADPNARPNRAVIPHQSIELFVKESSGSVPSRDARLLTEGLELPSFGNENVNRHRPQIESQRDSHFSGTRPHVEDVTRDIEPLGAMRKLEAFARNQLELELNIERESRKSSEGFAKELMRTLRTLETQLAQQVKLSETDRRMFEKEITGMRSNVEKLELERQSLLDAVVQEGSSSKSDALLRGELHALEQMNSKLTKDLSAARREAEILRASVVDLERARSLLEKEVHHRRKQQELSQQPGRISSERIRPTFLPLPYSGHEGVETVSASPKTRVSVPVERSPIGREKSLPPYSDHEGLDLLSISPKSVDPQRVPRESLAEIVKPPVRPQRSSVVVAPYSDHQGIEVVHSPKAIAPQRMAMSDLLTATARRTPSFPDIIEETIQTPPTPTTPKPRQDSPSPKVRVDISVVEKDLLQLNLERQELESWLGRFPPNTAGRTLAERKEKFLKEKRLAEIEKGISEKRLILKNARNSRINPTN